MRLWTIHPKYLDKIGLVALWRESLLAQKVLRGKTKGYRHHPQLERFKLSEDPMGSIGRYLCEVHREAVRRGYKFKRGKIVCAPGAKTKINVASGQVKYEFKRLLMKLTKRDVARHKALGRTKRIQVNPMFRVVKGKIEGWERI